MTKNSSKKVHQLKQCLMVHFLKNISTTKLFELVFLILSFYNIFYVKYLIFYKKLNFCVFTYAIDAVLVNIINKLITTLEKINKNK